MNPPPSPVDPSKDYTQYYPPPPELILPPFNGMPYPLPLTGANKHCPIPDDDDGMTIALPTDLHTGGINMCGKKVVVMFETLAGQHWPGPKSNLTVTVIDTFDSRNRSDVRQTLLLGEAAWKAATGNPEIDGFETWPMSFFFCDSDTQKQTSEGNQVDPDGEYQGGKCLP